MDEQELDDWFRQQRSRLEERFSAHRDTARFDRDYRRLLATYQRRQEAIYARSQRRAAREKRIGQWKERWQGCFESLRQAVASRKARLKAWLFNQRIRRILRQQQ